MLVRNLTYKCFKRSTVPSNGRLYLSKFVALRDNQKDIQDTLIHRNNECKGGTVGKKTVYPNNRLEPIIMKHPLLPDEDSPQFAGSDPPALRTTDVLVIGGGVVGTSIAQHLVERTGPGLQVTVLEKDPPELSSSLRIANNGLYQQVKSKPCLEMAQYAAEFYRRLNTIIGDPDLPKANINFMPSNSLCLASNEAAQDMQDLSALYSEARWKHFILSPSNLKQRFPWINVDDVALGCLGMQKEGIFDQIKAVAAMRGVCKKYEVNFLQGEVIGFQFSDLSQFASPMTGIVNYYTPRRAVIQTLSGEMISYQFAYVILAAGASMPDVTRLLNVKNMEHNMPVQPENCYSFEFFCPDGPGIEMPMVMESNGLKFRKKDLFDNFVVWNDADCEKSSGCLNPEASEEYFSKTVLPQLIQRVPTFKNSKFVLSLEGIIDRCLWDDQLLLGPLEPFMNVHIASGFANDEFLFAPAVGQGIAELILDQHFVNIDLSCFKYERIEADIKLNKLSSSNLTRNVC